MRKEIIELAMHHSGPSSRWPLIDHFKSVASQSPSYRADIDGLRAVAVFAVILFHLGFVQFQGGFVGVDVFFVISGYLITSLLVRDIVENKFSIASFYERRARRIFPALFTVLLFCAAFASLILNPVDLVPFGKALVTTTFFASNLFFWHSARPLGYFDSSVSAQPLLHTWSLSVEEQFYLVFPLILVLLLRFAKRRAPVLLAALACLAFCLNLWTTQHHPVFAFYWFAPRAWELLIGSILALGAVPHVRSRFFREFITLIGLSAIILSTFLPPFAGARFPGYIALFPCLGTGLVIYGGEGGPSLVKRFLSIRPIVFLGVISYSLYLWHWPLIVFIENVPLDLPSANEACLVIGLSVTLAILSFHFIELPFRGSRSRINRRQVFTFGAVGSLLTATFGVWAYSSNGLPGRYSPETRTLVAANLKRMEDFDATCSNWKTEVHSLSDIKFCALGDESQHKIMFWGDSHVEQLYPAIKAIYANGGLSGRGALIAIEDGCLPDQHLNYTGEGNHCDTFARLVLNRAKQSDIDEVFIGFSTYWITGDGLFCTSDEGKCIDELSHEDLKHKWLVDLADEIRELQSSGKRVIVCLPFPIFDHDIPQVEIYNATVGQWSPAVIPKDITSPSFREDIQEVAVGLHAELFDPRASLCNGEHCITTIDGVSAYIDSGHLAGSAVSVLDTSLQAALQDVDPVP